MFIIIVITLSKVFPLNTFQTSGKYKIICLSQLVLQEKKSFYYPRYCTDWHCGSSGALCSPHSTRWWLLKQPWCGPGGSLSASLSTSCEWCSTSPSTSTGLCWATTSCENYSTSPGSLSPGLGYAHLPPIEYCFFQFIGNIILMINRCLNIELYTTSVWTFSMQVNLFL